MDSSEVDIQLDNISKLVVGLPEAELKLAIADSLAEMIHGQLCNNPPTATSVVYESKETKEARLSDAMFQVRKLGMEVLNDNLNTILRKAAQWIASPESQADFDGDLDEFWEARDSEIIGQNTTGINAFDQWDPDWDNAGQEVYAHDVTLGTTTGDAIMSNSYLEESEQVNHTTHSANLPSSTIMGHQSGFENFFDNGTNFPNHWTIQTSGSLPASQYVSASQQILASHNAPANQYNSGGQYIPASQYVPSSQYVSASQHIPTSQHSFGGHYNSAIQHVPTNQHVPASQSVQIDQAGASTPTQARTLTADNLSQLLAYPGYACQDVNCPDYPHVPWAVGGILRMPKCARKCEACGSATNSYVPGGTRGGSGPSNLRRHIVNKHT